MYFELGSGILWSMVPSLSKSADSIPWPDKKFSNFLFRCFSYIANKPNPRNGRIVTAEAIVIPVFRFFLALFVSEK